MKQLDLTRIFYFDIKYKIKLNHLIWHQYHMDPSRHDWKIVDWDVKPQHNQKYHMAKCIILYFQVFFGTMQARNALSANSVGINCSTGMSSLFRREIVEAAGGLSTFSKYLAEDHFIANETSKQ